jgi:hypothetical protein
VRGSALRSDNNKLLGTHFFAPFNGLSAKFVKQFGEDSSLKQQLYAA